MVIVEKKFTSGKDLRLPGGPPGGHRGATGGVPGGVCAVARLSHPHLSAISTNHRHAKIYMISRSLVPSLILSNFMKYSRFGLFREKKSEPIKSL